MLKKIVKNIILVINGLIDFIKGLCKSYCLKNHIKSYFFPSSSPLYKTR